jgi:hypothetical protein
MIFRNLLVCQIYHQGVFMVIMTERFTPFSFSLNILLKILESYEVTLIFVWCYTNHCKSDSIFPI